ncbi:MAG: MBL fold metallo-hydrolase [Myxococcota bacterium]|nr:MBL fold metallo-hydrolase [Myxococcota bacterium]
MKQRNRFAFAARVGLCLALLWGVGCDRIVDTMMQRGIQQRTESVRTDLLEDDALNVFFCGTGAPLPDASSAGACTLVLAGGQLYVVDVGPGSQEVAQIAGMPTAALGGVFLTHFHSDHIGELGEWAMQSWVAGRDQPLDVYGPQGVDQVVNGFKQAYRQDDAYRLAHHGDDYLSVAATEWRPHAVAVAEGPGQKILEKNGLVVTAFAVDHRPVEPAVGYRFDYKGRSVVISGDTDQSANLERNAQGADLLIHEVLLKELLERMSGALGEAGHRRLEKLSADVVDYHTSPAEAVESANQAGVDTVVFTHLVPPVPGPMRSWLFTNEIDPGEVDVVVGEDGMLIRLPVGSREIEID